MTNSNSAAAVAQPGILAPPPPLGSYMLFRTNADRPDITALINSLADNFANAVKDGTLVVGFGNELMAAADSAIAYKRYLQPEDGHAPSPANPADLAVWLRGNDRGELFYLGRKIDQQLSRYCRLTKLIHSFTYRRRTEGKDVVAHDLSDFEDGIENPQGQAAIDAALMSSPATHLNGSSLWALQLWQHDFTWLEAASTAEKEHAIGRSLRDNQELADNKPSAHIVRTEQESFSPQAHMLRRSMPWCDDQLNAGLVFSCFAHSLYPFEVQLGRMRGCEDGIQDGVFQFSRILETNYFWCPPIDQAGRLRHVV